MDKPFLGICLGLQLLFEGSDRVRALRGFMCLTDRYFAYLIRKDLKYLT